MIIHKKINHLNSQYFFIFTRYDTHFCNVEKIFKLRRKVTKILKRNSILTSD